MGLADREGWKAGHRFHAKPGHAVLIERESRARVGRLGTRLLSEIPESAARLHCRLVERRKLGLRRRAVCYCSQIARRYPFRNIKARTVTGSGLLCSCIEREIEASN